ncbi:MAG: hypothetical protein ACI8QZ_003160 [Chlamydiales bacterium]|jgi:hypothetical protein
MAAPHEWTGDSFGDPQRGRYNLAPMLQVRPIHAALRPFISALLVVLVGAPALARQDEEGAPLPSTRAISAAWKKARKGARKEFPKALTAQVAELETHQIRLVREVLTAADLNLKKVPEHTEAPAYKARKHAPKSKAKHKVVKPGSPAARGFKRRMEADIPQRDLEPAWAYDYGAGQIVQIVEDPDDPERLFNNALAGYAPQLDLAEALLEQALDDGTQAVVAAAFGHAYSDRSGHIYPEITIYDAWCSGREIEMPDVMCLGIVHDVLDDWDTWSAPIPGPKQAKLYATIEDLFTDLRRFRGLRHALSRCYFNGSAVLRDDYESQLGTFQAVWILFEESQDNLASTLPGPDDWRDWLVGTAEVIDEDEDWAWDGGQERIQSLDNDREALRACLVRALLECDILK